MARKILPPEPAYDWSDSSPIDPPPQWKPDKLAAKIDRRAMPTGNASLAVKGENGTLRVTDAPQPPAGRVYQLWYQHGKTIERGGTLSSML